MRVLLDTHAFLWWVADSRRLSERARRLRNTMEIEGYRAVIQFDPDIDLFEASSWA